MIKYSNYKRESLLSSLCNKHGGFVLMLLSIVAIVSVLTVGCASKAPKEDVSIVPEAANTAISDVKTSEVDIPVEVESTAKPASKAKGELIAYDLVNTGRANPFMPLAEQQVFDRARSSAIAEANAHNAKAARYKRMKNSVIRELDDISPYSFNLPVPPTSLASSATAAARITRTKVVGIMFSQSSPTAIINVDSKDYLVRPGDKIIGEEYKVLQINPSWVTVGFGSNIYSASIGELFKKSELNQYQNDLYNLRNRFGGRKS